MHIDMSLDDLVDDLSGKEPESLRRLLYDRYATGATGTRFVDNEGYKTTSDMVLNERIAKILSSWIRRLRYCGWGFCKGHPSIMRWY